MEEKVFAFMKESPLFKKYDGRLKRNRFGWRSL